MRTDSLLLGALYLGEFSVLAVVLSLYVLGRKNSVQEFLQSRPGYVLAAAVLGLTLAAIIIPVRYRRSKIAGSKDFLLTVTMNLMTVIMLLGLGEATIRSFCQETQTGVVWGGKYLPSREWNDVVANYNEFFQNRRESGLYHVYDELLGWTIAPNRQGSEYGRHFSSAEGLRSREPGVVLADQPAAARIALLGDSYTFAEEVSFEDSWGHQLERQLGAGVQVLNFGVMGYGINQAYLRYMKEVRPWHPDVVILAFIDHNLDRTMGVYAFLTFPTSYSPYATPRFVMREQQLGLLNTPLPTPAQIFSAPSIHDLPYVQYDRNYIRGEWDRPYWRLLHRSYLFRWLTSWFPLREEVRPEVSEDAKKTISREIFRTFVKQVRDDGAIPLLVYFPQEPSLPGSNRYLPGYHPQSKQVLEEAHLSYLDPAPCLSQVPADERFAPEGHYSPQGNAAVARCLVDPIRALVQARTHAGKK